MTVMVENMVGGKQPWLRCSRPDLQAAGRHGLGLGMMWAFVVKGEWEMQIFCDSCGVPHRHQKKKSTQMS